MKKKKKIKPKLRLKLIVGTEGRWYETQNWNHAEKQGYKMRPAFCFTPSEFIIDLNDKLDPYTGLHDLSQNNALNISKTFLKFFNKHYRLGTVFDKKTAREIYKKFQTLVDLMHEFDYV